MTEARVADAAKTSIMTKPVPPLVFLATFLVAWFAQRVLWPHAPAPPTAARVLGMALVTLGLASGLSSIAIFLAHRTTARPEGQPRHFIAVGPYRVTRNPMYVGLTLSYLGAVAWTGTWLAAPLVIVPLAHLMRWIIPMEEAHLHASFGAAYDDYRRRVRRWI